MVRPEVLRFSSEVRIAFRDDREKYYQYLYLFADLKARRIDASVFVAKLNTLFEGHKYLLWEYNKILPKDHKLLSKDASKDVSEFFKAVKVAVKDDYGDFVQVMEDYSKRNIDESCLLARAKVLLRRHAYLIREFNTLFLPARSHITIPNWDQLPWDVLHVISQKLDFDDLFQFSRVCTDWRVFHKSIDKSNFLTSQEPLLLEVLYCSYKVPRSLISLPNQKVYPLKNMMMNGLSYSKGSFFPIYITCSSGYFVIVADNSSFLLINPITRIKKKVIYPSTFKFKAHCRFKYRALLAFDKCSEEFVLVFSFRMSTTLHVYQSRNNAWVTYSTVEDLGPYMAVHNIVVDFVAFNNIIYVVTHKARIGVLSLNSAKIEFLKMVNCPTVALELELHSHRSPLNLVKCDEELLLVRLNPFNPDVTALVGPPPERKVYKIDFSTMTYVKLQTLGDIALFYVCFRTCQALSNPTRWGYESNSVHDVCNCIYFCPKNPNCTVYNWDSKSKKYIVPPNPKTKYILHDWYFRHLKYEVDYSLVS